ncbi:hypothetical protein [Roseateles sp. L2-2]|uniref:hypothetical protein n=1 Tax=Roseateles sp. L2-2 TaxID=3422597 RepID=UPI0026A3BA2A
MTLKRTLIVLAVLSLLSGCVSGYSGLHHKRLGMIEIPLTFAFMAVVYAWYRRDSIQRRFFGGTMMGGGILAATLLVVPIYLYSSRPEGERARPILAFLGLMLLSMVLSTIGALPFMQ